MTAEPTDQHTVDQLDTIVTTLRPLPLHIAELAALAAWPAGTTTSESRIGSTSGHRGPDPTPGDLDGTEWLNRCAAHLADAKRALQPVRQHQQRGVVTPTVIYDLVADVLLLAAYLKGSPPDRTTVTSALHHVQRAAYAARRARIGPEAERAIAAAEAIPARTCVTCGDLNVEPDRRECQPCRKWRMKNPGKGSRPQQLWRQPSDAA